MALERFSIRSACILGVAAALTGGGERCHAQPDYGWDFVTIGAPGNAGYDGPDISAGGYVTGRGSVAYEYRIGRTELTTGQWLEFVNTFANRVESPAFQFGAVEWGGIRNADGTFRLSSAPGAAQWPVAGIGWRDAARYCNWLNNGKSGDLSAIAGGAYDTTTWNETGPIFTDSPTHEPGARFWIPTLDEALKASYFDPRRFGPGQAGWWYNTNRSDSPGTPGAPGVGTTSAGWTVPGQLGAQWEIPVGSYAASVSPWGLLDTSGGAVEWTEYVVFEGFPINRGMIGAYAGDRNYVLSDQPGGLSSYAPFSSGSTGAGLRIASSVPPPSTILVLVAFGFSRTRRRS